MIDCTNQKIWYNRKFKKKKRILKLFIWFLVISFLILYFFYLIPKNIYNFCFDTIYSSCNDSVNSSILMSLQNKVNYNDLIYIEKDNQGNVSFMSTNSQKVNQISRDIVSNTKMILQNKLNEGIDIPYLAFTGINFISGYGRTTKLKNLSVSDVSCGFISKFESVGINQTLHSIYVNIKVQVRLSCLLSHNIQQTNCMVLISETVLVGKVPSTYLNGKLFS